jgi:low temperature requirement protein LtrA
MWWIYFDLPTEEIVTSARRAFMEHVYGAFVWGYGHYFVFASVAATGAGLDVAIKEVTTHSTLTPAEAGLTLTVPVAVYLLVVWALHFRFKPPGVVRVIAVPLAVACVLASSLTPQPVLATGIVLVVLVAVGVADSRSVGPVPSLADS